MKKYEKELNDAIKSGDVNRIAIAKNRLHQRKMKLSSTPIQNLNTGSSSVLSEEEQAAKNAKSQQIAGGVGMAANVASGFIDPNNTNGSIDVGGSAIKSGLQMAGSGVAAGAMLGGVPGAIIGGSLGLIGGALTGGLGAKKRNEKLRKQKAAIKQKSFVGRMNLASNEEENSFNVNSPQYLAKGGLVKTEKNSKEVFAKEDLDAKEERAQIELKNDQEFLSKIFDEKYGELTGVNLKDILRDFTLKKDYNRKNLGQYHKELSEKYQDLALTPEEVKSAMGEERYNKYVENKKIYANTEWGKFNKTQGDIEGDVDPSKENYGWRNIIERYRWSKDKGDVSPYLYYQNSLLKDEKGGIVSGIGNEISDSNQKNVEVGSTVMPSPKNAPKAIKNAILNIAEGSGVDNELKSVKKTPTKATVNLSRGELVIPPEKIMVAESIANAQGTTLASLRNDINAVNDKSKTKKKGINLALGTDEVKRDKYIGGDGQEYYYPSEENKLSILKPKLLKEPTVDSELSSIKKYERINGKKSTIKNQKNKFSIAPEAAVGLLQTAVGTIGRNRNESKINQSLAIQDAIAKQSIIDSNTAAAKSLSAKKASINTMFKDTQSTADKLKTQAINDLASNSLTSQEFSSNYNKVAGTVLDSVSRANREKTSLLLDAESQGQLNIQNTIERGATRRLGIEGKKNAFNLAKATQSGQLQQAGMENLLAYMKNIKDEKVRKQKMAEIIAISKERNISIQDAATIMLGDLEQGVSNNIKLS